jgi:tol-pal system protein YbgF
VIRRSIRLALVPVVVMTAGACFATRNDVRTLQGDIAVLRAENARSDSVHRAQFAQAAQQVGAVSDSLRALNAFLVRFSADVSRFQGDLSINMHTFGQQLIALQELTGQNQKKLQDVRAQFERQEAEMATAAQPSTAAPGVQGTAAAAPTGPNQLYNMGMAQLNRGTFSAARAAFEGLLDQYPTSDLAGEAEWAIGRSYDGDGNAAAADSVYAIVVAKYPKTEHASNALYKRAMAAKQAGNAAAAKVLFQQILDQYPRSPEANTVSDILKKP